MGGTRPPNDADLATGRLHQLLVLGGLGLLFAGLLLTGVFGSAIPAAPDLEDGTEPPVTDGDFASPDGDGPAEEPPSDDAERSDDDDEPEDEGGVPESVDIPDPGGTDSSEDNEEDEENDGNEENEDGTPEFVVADVEVPGTATAGDVVEVVAEIENRGDGAGTTNATLEVAGEVYDRTAVELEADDGTTVTFELDTSDVETGQHQVGVTTGSDGEWSQIDVVEDGEPAFMVTGLEVPENATIGDQLLVEYTVRNTGEADGTADVGLEFEDDVVHEEELTLAPGESLTRTAQIDTSDYDEGDHPVLVVTPDDSDQDWVTLTEADDDGDGAPPDDDDEEDDGADDPGQGDDDDEEDDNDDGDGDDDDDGGFIDL